MAVNANSFKKAEGISIYCHCHLPYKPEEPMIQCGHFKEWYHVRRLRKNAGILKPSGFAVFAVELSCTLVCVTYIVHKNIFHLHLPYSKCLYCVVFVKS